MVLFKHRAILFGGVHDVDKSNLGAGGSTFFNDLHVIDMEHRRWYEMPLKQKPEQSSTKSGRRRKVVITH